MITRFWLAAALLAARGVISSLLIGEARAELIESAHARSLIS